MPLSLNSVWFSCGRILTALLLACAISAMIASGVPLALGQGGTGRTNTNSTSPKKTTPKKTAPPAKRRSNANSKNSPSSKTLESIKTPSGIDLVWIPPGGVFMMGSNGGNPDEQPIHNVTFVVDEVASAVGRFEFPKAEAEVQAARRDLKRIRNLWESALASKAEYDAAQDRYIAAKAKLDSLRTTTGEYGFYIGKYEVTQAQWQTVMGGNPSYFKNCDNCPVEQVSWIDVQEFLEKLNERNDGFRYRLPTEAEWEYACRAGTGSDHAGNVDRLAWYDKNSGEKTHPVGQRAPNPFGLYDMTGNVWEWCLDSYHKSYDGAPTDGSAWLSQQKVEGFDSYTRVLRGGSYQVDVWDLRSSSRYRYAPDHRYMSFGFRVVAVARTQ